MIPPKEIAALFADPDWARRFPLILTVDQAAELIQISKLTIYDWSSRGLLDSCKSKGTKRLRLLRNQLIHIVFNEGINGKK